MSYYYVGSIICSDDDIYHYGTKGMKWGVRNGPPYPVARKRYVKSKIIKNALASGQISSKINKDKQARHLQGGKYIKGRSFIYGNLKDAQRLVNKLSGTGVPVFDRKGNWLLKERVVNNRPVGICLSVDGGKPKETNKAMIVYSKTGAHIMPRKDG